MAKLIPCPACKNEISTNADACPKCGEPITPDIVKGIIGEQQRKSRRKGKLFGVVGAVFVILWVIGNWDSASTGTGGQTGEKASTDERYAAARAKRAQTVAEFEADAAGFIADAKTLVETPEVLIEKYGRFRVAENEEMMALISNAENQIEIKALLIELKTIPAANFNANMVKYAKLMKLDPGNATYKAKHDHYSAKYREVVREQQRVAAKKAAATARLENIHRQFSQWDGSHLRLERYVKSVMNDPDSYDHVKTVYGDRGDYLLVQTTFRGKNAFGGVVANSVTAKVSIQDGSLISIESD